MDLAALYADLAERAWLALAEVKARAATRDEDLGHDFHGNQWTGGLGAKPKTHSQKTSKAAVHELLSSGHPFTKAELMEIAGIKTEKLFSDYMAMLKNPKYAGPKGALSIQAKDGHYYVALPGGDQAPPPGGHLSAQNKADIAAEAQQQAKPGLPPHLQKVVEKLGPAAKASHTVTEVHVPGYTEAPAAAPPGAPAAPSVEPGVPSLLAAHPGSLPKGEADKHYALAMEAANAAMVAEAKAAITIPKAEQAVLKWKNAKASAMAAWAQAVHGGAYSPKKQELFLADKSLAKLVVLGTPIATALATWKTNTAGEKAGTWPEKKATPASKAAATEAQPVADMGHAAHVEPIDYGSLVPASHEPIGPADFASQQGAWSKGISKFKSELMSGAAQAATNKKSVEAKLRDRLKDRPNFQALVKRLGLAKEGQSSLEARLVSAWAGSSGDTHDISVALQMAVRDAFAIPDQHVEKKALNSLNVYGNDVDKLTKAAIQSLNGNIKPLETHEVQTARAALQEFVQAQYHETQDLLQKLGHDHVYLARGMKVGAAHDNAKGAANVRLQPASSFSASYTTANAFAGGHTVFLVKVPRQQVLGTYLTGFGCTNEHEVVVLAHNNLKAYTVGAHMSQEAASSVVHKQVQPSLQVAAAGKVAAGIAAATKAQAPAPGTTKAALQKAVINAKSKAYKAAKAAAAAPHKQAHATQAAEEAKAAVQALQAWMSQGGKKK